MAQPRPELCSVECPDGSWISPSQGLVREVQVDEVEPSRLSIDDELRSYLAGDDPAPARSPGSNRRSESRIRVRQHRAVVVINPGRVLGAARPLLASIVADASEKGLGLRLVAAERPLIQPNDPVWVRLDNTEQLELPARVVWCKGEALGVRIELSDTTLEERYQTWLRRATFGSRPDDEG